MAKRPEIAPAVVVKLGPGAYRRERKSESFDPSIRAWRRGDQADELPQLEATEPLDGADDAARLGDGDE